VCKCRLRSSSRLSSRSLIHASYATPRSRCSPDATIVVSVENPSATNAASAAYKLVGTRIHNACAISVFTRGRRLRSTGLQCRRSWKRYRSPARLSLSIMMRCRLRLWRVSSKSGRGETVSSGRTINRLGYTTSTRSWSQRFRTSRSLSVKIQNKLRRTRFTDPLKPRNKIETKTAWTSTESRWRVR
jgi:hypothetical protein